MSHDADMLAMAVWVWCRVALLGRQNDKCRKQKGQDRDLARPSSIPFDIGLDPEIRADFITPALSVR
jgi:hypothetical protein